MTQGQDAEGNMTQKSMEVGKGMMLFRARWSPKEDRDC